eukprot:TRINITY_DN5373_c0_g1_i1.p1 TRINITY_DN5373_c0_g1~~TRINITY_DN5373_c0_g1_i1.p1  ORF type:complete len:202 (+),score=77.29 TRINITY_DN5373_c0_g1_i1:161-766(+)
MLRASMSGQPRGLFGNRRQLFIVTVVFAVIFITNLIIWPNKLDSEAEFADYSRSPLGNLHRNHDPESTSYLALQKLLKGHKLKGKDENKMKWGMKEEKAKSKKSMISKSTFGKTESLIDEMKPLSINTQEDAKEWSTESPLQTLENSIPSKKEIEKSEESSQSNNIDTTYQQRKKEINLFERFKLAAQKNYNLIKKLSRKI